MSLPLALAATCAQVGCIRTVNQPNFANFGSHLREGNQVNLVMKDGKQQTGWVTAIRPDGIMLNGSTAVSYDAIQAARRIFSDSGGARYRAKETLAPAVAVIAVAGAVVACPFLPLLVLLHANSNAGCCAGR